MNRRPFVALVAALAGIGLFTGVLAWVLDSPSPPAGAGRGQRLYVTFCGHCHGEDGTGSWRASLFLIRPGDLTDRVSMQEHGDDYLFDIIKYGGSPVGRPGMPGFEHVSDDDVRELVRYLRTLSSTVSTK